MNRPSYVPKMPNQPELDLIFDTSFVDIQPYLFKVRYFCYLIGKSLTKHYVYKNQNLDLVRDIATINIDGNYRAPPTQGHPLYLE